MSSVTEKINNIMDAKHKFMLSNLSKQSIVSKRGVPEWKVENVFETMIQDALSIEARGGTSNNSLLATLQGIVKPTVEPAVDPLQQQISKSLHAIHKRQDASDELLAKIANKLEL
tara:strand:- start:133 stop:477 length:345 start_codon:yes stop_codon:yes gene_type:complete